ncbi:cytochrome c biogenesis protein ResB [Actinoplanes sp. N902-109]|uniref:cytochrome c biogenesis protein ResB n=1 Tax=Actinoplanes sp. (strain N902-109) TaxID=649831 RepID=UPI0003293E63|nr:cytochrome c biogenesis protein ResB [Actinoplanes sp. N902-109]AGL13823.1 resB family protein [Actinoplanes sp. N902-109]
MTVVEERSAPAAAPPPRRSNPAWALLRNSWRQLTSMRTALVLLFLLAVAAIPGSVLPQRAVSPEKVTAYFADHPELAPKLDQISGFDVYSSAWFAAIYLLLFTSLIGCVCPRLLDHFRALRSVPPDAPRRLERLPEHVAAAERPDDPAAAAQAAAAALRKRRFRTKVREREDGTWTVSAEKGYLKETGNLLFHAALLTVLIGVGFGHWYGWHGNRILVEGQDQGFCNSVTQYDESALGPRVDPADLPFFCLRLQRFEAAYQTSGQPKTFDADVDVQTEQDGSWQSEHFTVNNPLRLAQADVHLTGHGYAVVVRYTDRYGQSQTKVVPFLPRDGLFTSEGVASFPDVNIDPRTNKRDVSLQVGFTGVYVPTVDPNGGASSVFPAENNPALFLTAYRGDLGVEVGNPGSVYTLDQGQIDNGELKKVSGDRPQRLTPGQSWTLDDGTKLEFVGTRPFVTLAVRHDPAALYVLGGAVAGLLGLVLSLGGHRRRMWFRISPRDGSGSLMEAGGLPRTDYPGFGEEFGEVVGAARGPDGGTP